MVGFRGIGVALAIALAASTADAVVIDFDGLAAGVAVTNQFPEATFSSDPGFEVQTTAQNLGTSLPNFICTALADAGLTCTNSVFVDFAAPVNNLTFLSTGDNDVGTVGQVRVFENGIFSSTVDIPGDGNAFMPNLVDLSSFTNVTRIEVVNVTDAGGLGFDDFTFDQGPLAIATCHGFKATIVGTNGDDLLVGTASPDVIAGLGGNDTIRGGDGDDLICGDGGDDTIQGGKGHDVLLGGAGHDTLNGGGGADECVGGPARDVFHHCEKAFQ